jgi:hypothetical protein
MIAQAVVDEVRRLLLDEVLSQRKIARRLGISRGTVGAIAQGRRSDYSRSDECIGLLAPPGPPRRCPGCGGLVQMPCLLCHIRAMKAARR